MTAKQCTTPPSARTRPREAAARFETSSMLDASAVRKPSEAGVATPEGGTENRGTKLSPGGGDGRL